MADRLGIGRFMTMGISTGGAYSLCVAALYPERVIAVATGCAMTDMSHPPAMESMPGVGTVGLAPSREEAIAIAEDQFGVESSGNSNVDPQAAASWGNMPAADIEVMKASMTDPAAAEAKRRLDFANGMQGYTDDRRADAPGWSSFDVGQVSCPVTICQ